MLVWKYLSLLDFPQRVFLIHGMLYGVRVPARVDALYKQGRLRISMGRVEAIVMHLGVSLRHHWKQRFSVI